MNANDQEPKILRWQLLGSMLAALCLWATESTASAETTDPLAISPQQCVVALDNARLRLLETHLKPGEMLPMHSHPNYAVYALTTASLRLRKKGGATREVKVKPGMAAWNTAETHEVENMGDTESRILHVELK
jgi:hypothetical protein